MALNDDICALVDYACATGLIGAGDRVWAYNSVLEAVGATGPGPSDAWVLDDRFAVLCAGKDAPHAGDAGEPRLGSCGAAPGAGVCDSQPGSGRPFDLEATLARLAETAVEAGVAQDTATGRDRASMRVMGTLTPRPSEVEARFGSLMAQSGAKAATDWFYKLCCDAGYVRRAAIARNVAWTTPTRWGGLEITINLSKPEKDPRDIARAGAAPSTGEKYPACQLCIENEGYPGRAASDAGGAHPARQNLRIVPIELGGERWGLQYSPYAYFNEHCIAMSVHHRHMHIDRAAITCLLDFVDLLPQYFIGSNADLPVVGGSILSHDHFQGGGHVFPMMRAKVSERFAVPGFPAVSGEVLEWPLSVLRLSASDRAQLLEAAGHVIDAWRSHTDEAAGVIARTSDGVAHNTVTPVARKDEASGTYELYLALRCNIATAEHPLGVFHPHEQWHHIKKENIGLIEVMGLAILPARLVGELGAVRAHVLAGDAEALKADPLSAPHARWAEQCLLGRGLGEDDVDDAIRGEVGHVFCHVLEDAGVFKWDEAGRLAQRRFLASL